MADLLWDLDHPPPPPRYEVQDLKEAADLYADHYGVPRDMFKGYLSLESNWNPGQVNPSTNGRGLAGISDGQAQAWGLKVTGGPDDDRHDPGKSLDAVGKEMARLYGEKKNWKAVLLALGQEPTEEYYQQVKGRALYENQLAPWEAISKISYDPGRSLYRQVSNYLGYRELPESLPVYNRDTGKWEAKTVFEARKIYRGGGPTEMQIVLQRAASGLSFGATDILVKDIWGEIPEAETTVGAGLAGAAEFLGFYKGPIKAAHKLIGTRLNPTRTGLRGVAELMRQGGATLGLASSLSAVLPSLMESPSLDEAAFNIVRSGVSGALVGALFPVAGIVPTKPLRVAAGLAALDFLRTRMHPAPGQGWFSLDDVVQGALDGTIDRRVLARKAFDYAMDIYFLARTPSMRKTLTDLKLNSMRQSALMDEAARVNPEEAEDSLLKLAETRREWEVGPAGAERTLEQVEVFGKERPEHLTPEEYVERVRVQQAKTGELSEQDQRLLREDHKQLVAKGLAGGSLTPEEAARLGHFETYPELAAQYQKKVAPPAQEAPWKKPWELSGEESIARHRALDRDTERNLDRGEFMPKPKTDKEILKRREVEVREALKRGEEVPVEIKAEFIQAAEKHEKGKAGPEMKVERVPVAEIATDPAAFQFKLGAEETTGAGLALGDVRAWEEGMSGVVTLWRSPEGKLYVVNGHQRLAAAKRLGVPEVRAQILSAAEWSQTQARSYGAMINMAEGRGTEVDMAKFIRDSGYDLEKLALSGLSLSEAKTRRALALSQVSDGIFEATALGRFPLEKAVILGEELPGNHPAQEAIFREMANLEAKGRLNSGKFRELVRLAKGAGVTVTEQLTLFGKAELQKSHLREKADLLEHAKRQLREDKSVFGLAARKKSKLEEAKNIIDPESNEKISQEAAEFLYILDKTAYDPDSAVYKILNDFAGKLAAGKQKNEVRNEFYREIKEALRGQYREYFPLLPHHAEAEGRGGPEAGAAGVAGPEGTPPPGERGELQAPEVTPAPPGRPGEIKLGSGGPDTRDLFRTFNDFLKSKTKTFPIAPPEAEISARLDQVRRALPELSEEQARILAEDPELFSQVARGELAAQEANKLLTDRARAFQEPQRPLEGLEEGQGLFGYTREKKLYSGGPGLEEVQAAGQQAMALGSRLIDWIDKRLERNLPPELRDKDASKNIGVLLLKIQNFEDIGRTYPEAKPYFTAARAGLALKMLHAQEYFSLMAPYSTLLNPEERARVDKVLVRLDAENSDTFGHDFRIRDLDTFQKHLQNPLSEVREKGTDFYRSLGLTPKEAEGALGVRLALDYAKILNVEYHSRAFREWAIAHGFEAEQVRSLVDWVLNTESPAEAIAEAYFGPRYGKSIPHALTNFREAMQYWLKQTHHYVPHSRYGDYFIRVFDKATGEQVWAAAVESKGAYHDRLAEVQREFPEAEYLIESALNKQLPMELWTETYMPRVTRLVHEAGKSMTIEAREAMLEAWMDFQAAKGFGAHYIKRRNIPGFETDLLRPLHDYLAGSAGYFGKMEKIRGFSEAHEKMPKEMPELFREMNEYTNYILSNPKEFEGIRNLIYNWALGGNISFHFVNALQNINTGWAVLGKAGPGPLKALAGAHKDWARYVATGEGLRPGEDAALARARIEPELSPSGVSELSGRAYNPLYRWLHNDPTSLSSKGMDWFKAFWYGEGVEKMNRETFFLAAWRQTGGDYGRSLELTREAHFLYGKETRPIVGRGAGSLPFIFMTYTVNYFTLLKNFGKAAFGVSPEIYGTKVEGVQGLSRMMAGAMVTGGLTASFLGPMMKKAWQMVFGTDIEDEAKDYFTATFKGSRGAGEFVTRALFRGLPAAALGIDISSRIAPNLPFMNLPEGALTWERFLAATFGAASMPAQRAFMVGSAVAHKDWARALEFAVPVSLQNLLAARRLGTQGGTTLKGQPLFTREGKPLVLEGSEIFRKAMGLQPVRLAEHHTAARHARQMEEGRRDKVQNYAGRLAQAFRDKDEQAYNDTIAEWLAYNNKLLKQGRFADLVSPKAVETAMERRFQPKYPDVSQEKMILRRQGRSLAETLAPKEAENEE